MNDRVAARIRYKISALVALIVIFVLLGNAWSERRTAQLARSFASVYKDRLLAESYLMDLADLLHRESRLMQHPATDEPLAELRTRFFVLDTALDRIIEEYQDTYLTADEKVLFARLRTNVAMVRELQQQLLDAPARPAWWEQNSHRLDQVFALTSTDLEELSRIQLVEGYDLKESSTQLLANATLFAKLQMVVVLIAGMIIQALLSDARLTLANGPDRQSLN